MPKPKRAEKNRSPSPGFQFISVTDYAQVKSSHNVSLVRGHVMRQMRRQQQQSALAGNGGEPSKSGSARSSPSRSSIRSQTPQPTFSSFENSSLDRLISIEPPKKVKRLMPKNEPKEEEKNSDDESVSSTKTGSSPGPHPTSIIPMDSTARELLQYCKSRAYLPCYPILMDETHFSIFHGLEV